MITFDLIVLGTGPAASRVAQKCAAEKWNVAIVESREFGGTCALRGCNPKKVLVNAAELVDWSRRADGKLARTEKQHIDWRELIEFKRQFTKPVKQNSEANFRKDGIATFHGPGRFREPQCVEVNGELLHGEKILIAVGAKPSTLGIPGEELIKTSDGFLELEELPESVLFIGGGYISFEFAHVAARAGSRVTILDRGRRPLKQFDPDLVQRLADHSTQLGINIVPNAEATAIEKSETGTLAVEANVAGKVCRYSSDLVVHGAGRTPNLEGMELETGQIEFSWNGITVNDYLQSVSNASVFAAGDCADTSTAKLTPIANQQARTIAQNLLAGELKHVPDYGAIPSAVFTVPPLAAVGMSEADAKEQGLDFETLSGDMSEWGSVRKVCESCAGYKILVDNQSDQILGAHLIGPSADETINLFAMAMKFNLTAKNVKSVLFTFPTFASDVRSML